jgi:hypothetical protein
VKIQKSAPSLPDFDKEEKAKSCKCIREMNEILQANWQSLDTIVCPFVRASPATFEFGPPTLRCIVSTVREKQQGRKPPPMIAEYCPFCGQKYDDLVKPRSTSSKKRRK